MIKRLKAWLCRTSFHNWNRRCYKVGDTRCCHWCPAKEVVIDAYREPLGGIELEFQRID